MSQRIWNNWRRDEYATFYHPDPPWTLKDSVEEAPALPLPRSGTLQANSLNRDIWLLILELLPMSALLKTMALVSKDFHDLCMSVLYVKVDLNLHHYRIEEFLGWPTKRSDHPGHYRPERVGRQHCRFVRQLLRTPKYANHVRLFTWTMDASHCVRRDYSLENEIEQVSAQLRMFEFLQNVTKVDIDGGRTSLPTLPHSTSLFPKAHSIRLGGLMQWTLASAILHGKDKASLTSLTLYNLLERGHLHDASPYAPRHHRRSRGEPTLPVDAIKEEWPAAAPPVAVRPGCMRRLLTTELVSRCRNLDSLYFRKQGQQHAQQQLPSEVTYEDEVYDEWASFIAQVHPRHLRIEHGGSTAGPQSDEMQTIAPMDVRFRDIIDPVLRPGWSRLQTLEIHGVCDEVTQPLVEAFEQRVPALHVHCDPALTWCWNAELSHSHITILYPFVNPPGAHDVAETRGRGLRPFSVPLEEERKHGEYFREQDRQARFMFEEGLITEVELERRVNRVRTEYFGSAYDP